jgi:hypothetical protein
MLAVLIVLSSCADFVSLDLGTQFFKFAESTSLGEAKIFKNPVTNMVNHPNAVALKFPAAQSLPITADDFSKIDVRFGKRALSLMKHNSSLGADFLPACIGRNAPEEFRTSQFIDESELFLFALNHSVASLGTFVGACLAVPFFYTRQQISSIRDSCETLSIPIWRVITDADAVFTLYASTRLTRFASAPRHVMFVDIGSTTSKVYSARFSYDNSNPVKDIARVHQTSVAWSENVGGYHFAKSLARARGISLQKAHKLLIRSQYGRDTTIFDVSDLKGMIARSVDAAGDVDELQLVGGASSFPFVVDAVREASGLPIRRDFNQNEAVALGALIHLLIFEGHGPYIPSAITGLCASTYRITCGSREAVYCTAGEEFAREVKFDGLDEVCRDFRIVGDPDTMPRGSSREVGLYHARENVDVEGSELTAAFRTSQAEIHIEGVEWCSGTDCRFFESEEIVSDKEWIRNGHDKLVTHLARKRETELRVEVRDLLRRLTDIGTDKMDIVLTDEMKNCYIDAANEERRDAFEGSNATKLDQVKRKLEEVFKVLNPTPRPTRKATPTLDFDIGPDAKRYQQEML